MSTTQNKKESDKFKDLIGPMDPKLDAQVREKLITARVGLLLRASFFGNLATRLKLVNADEWCPTAATEGRHFYYNSEFISKLSLRETEFLFGHEVLHVVYDHMGRRGDREPAHPVPGLPAAGPLLCAAPLLVALRPAGGRGQPRPDQDRHLRGRRADRRPVQLLGKLHPAGVPGAPPRHG